MKIVILDGYTLNPGDLDWGYLSQSTIHPRTSTEQLVERAQGAEVLLTNKTILNENTLARLPNLKYIGILATGTNCIDLSAAKKQGIVVSNVPAYGASSVAQAVFALLLEMTNRVSLHAQSVSSGEWQSCPDFSYWKSPLIELSSLTMGIVGFGEIGRAVAQRALAFDMRVVVHTRSEISFPSVTFVNQETLFEESDVLSLHCPLTESTEKMINAQSLEKMKASAYLINTGRGGLVDEMALANALNEHKIAGAGLDVLSVEPPTSDNPLLQAKNCTITPHQAWATRAARQRLMDIAIDNIKNFCAGTPSNVVS